jgi:hypothetical protein
MPASVGLMGVWSMTKRSGLLVGFCLLLAFPIAALAQDVVPEPLPFGASPLGGTGASGWFSGVASLPGLNWIQAGDISIRPSVLVGYKKIGFDVGLGISPTQLLSPFGILFPQWGSLLDLFPLNMKVQSADLAVGGFRLDAQITQACSLFGSVSANIPRSVDLFSSIGPGFGVLQPQSPRSWRGSGFQWSEFDVGGCYGINRAVGLVAGIKFDRISVRFSEPAPVPSYVLSLIGPDPTITFPDYSGDLNTFFTIPYIGAQFFGPYFKGSLIIGSAGARLRLPLDLTHPTTYYALGLIGLTGRRDLSEQAEYTFKNPGLFLEGDLESTFPVGLFNCTFWAKGSWLRIRGDADVTTAGRSSFFLLALTLPQPFSGSTSGTSTINQYTFDVGLSSAISF